jgi:hypothetical protein
MVKMGGTNNSPGRLWLWLGWLGESLGKSWERFITAPTVPKNGG